MGKIGLISLVLALPLVFSPRVTASAPVAVTACGQVVSGRAELTGDLDCSGEADPEPAVTVKTGRLELNGFTITGKPAGGVLGVVECKSRCKILGPGTITRIVGPPPSTITMDAGILGRHGIFRLIARVYVFGVTISNTGVAVSVNGINSSKITVRDSTITNNGAGVGSPFEVKVRVRVEGSTISSNVAGVQGFKVKIKDSTITNNVADGVECTDAVIKDSVITNNGGSGVRFYGQATRIRGSEISGNGCHGVLGLRPLLKNCILTGNGTDPECGVNVACADITTVVEPRVGGALTCDTSLNLLVLPGTVSCGAALSEVDGTWGICAQD